MVVQWNINVQVVSDFMDGMSPPAHHGMTQAFNMLAARSSGDSGGVSGRAASSARGRGKTYQNR